LINVPNQNCPASVIHEGFDPIPDMGRSIDSRILVMCHAAVDTADFPNNIGPTLNRRHLSLENRGMGRSCEPHIGARLSPQRALHNPSP
jgi:hypothetical protein